MFTRRSFLITATALPVVTMSTRPAFAAEPEIFSRDGAAINGYDPVAYFTQSAPVKGDAAYNLTWKEAQWYFASAESKAMFEATPGEYAPQYGGYCAYAVSKGSTAKTEPDAWTVYEGKLYLNYNRSVRALWSRDIPGNITRANANWPGVLS